MKKCQLRGISFSFFQIDEKRYHRIFRNDPNLKVIKSIGVSAGISHAGDRKFICLAGRCDQINNLVLNDDGAVDESVLAEAVGATNIAAVDDAASASASTSTPAGVITRAKGAITAGTRQMIGSSQQQSSSAPQINQVKRRGPKKIFVFSIYFGIIVLNKFLVFFFKF